MGDCGEGASVGSSDDCVAWLRLAWVRIPASGAGLCCPPLALNGNDDSFGSDDGVDGCAGNDDLGESDVDAADATRLPRLKPALVFDFTAKLS
jgi:hypothetical protein